MPRPSAKLRNRKFEKNITKRGQAKKEKEQESGNIKIGAVMLGFFVFLVVGSALFQIIGTLTKTDSSY